MFLYDSFFISTAIPSRKKKGSPLSCFMPSAKNRNKKKIIMGTNHTQTVFLESMLSDNVGLELIEAVLRNFDYELV